MNKRSWKRAAITLALLVCVLHLGLWIVVRAEPFPEKLRGGAPEPSLRVLDRGGLLLSEVTREGERVGGVRLGELPPHVIDAVLSAEDARFFDHPGVDVLALTRATFQAVIQRRVVSGASTITQQLARSAFSRPRTLLGKLKEMVIALRIEREWDKPRILEAYLNHVEFGPRLIGLEAASQALFDKPASRLDLAEAALLVGLPRGPSLYDPTKGTERAQRRRDRILLRMRDHGSATEEQVARASAQPIHLNKSYRSSRAQHFTRALARGQLTPGIARGELREVRTTLDAALQAEVEGLARTAIDRLRENDATATAALVIDNRTREVLAYVGSQDFWSTAHLGQNDGVRALRQPGSTLKPFVYAAAMQNLGYTAATTLPDVELRLPTPQGAYSPRNYDGLFHGPVRLRQALASSLNVPAVYAAQRVGPERVLDLLHQFGFDSLNRDASYYGAAIALGDGEVTLAELAAAYTTLANHGRYQPLSYVQTSRGRPAGEETELALSEIESKLLIDLLADQEERQSSFGRDSVLNFPFDVAVKTGTSKGYRDNWTVGFSSEITVAVWVGNFDGRPMKSTSGVTGAGPLFREILLAAMRSREAKALRRQSQLPELEICTLSGALPGPACEHRTREIFLPGSQPHHICEFHERVEVLPDTGLRAGPACPSAVTRSFERYDEPYRAWAQKARRPLAPTRFDPRCPGTAPSVNPAPGITYPFDGARFQVDPSLSSAQQRLVFRARAPEGTRLRFLLNGEALEAASPRHEFVWPLTPGSYSLLVESEHGRSAAVRFSVDASR